MSNGESCSHWKHEKGNSKQNHYKETETIQLGSGRYGHYKFAYTKETSKWSIKANKPDKKSLWTQFIVVTLQH